MRPPGGEKGIPSGLGPPGRAHSNDTWGAQLSLEFSLSPHEPVPLQTAVLRPLDPLLKCSTHSCPDDSFSTQKSLLRLPQRHRGFSSVSVTDCLEIASIQDLDPSGPGRNPGPARGPRPPGQARSPQGQLRGPPVCPMLSSGLRGWGGGRAQAGWRFTRFTGRQPPPGSSSPLETLHAGFSGAQDAWG